MFRVGSFALAAALATTVAAPAATSPDPVLAALPTTIAVAFIDDNAATLRASCASGATITDRFAPYWWSGLDACARWGADFKAFAKAAELSSLHSSMESIPYIRQAAGHAYVTVKVHFTAIRAGRHVEEEGVWTFAVAKIGSRWKITAIAWGTLTAAS